MQNSIADHEFTSLREKMAYHFPYNEHKPLSNHIWQTWKVGKDDPSFPSNYHQYQSSWDAANKDYQHDIIADSHIDSFVAKTFAKVPEVVEAYNLLPKNILKADFFRYLVVFARGGTYSDIDTVCLKPIASWASFDKQYVEPHYQNIKAKHPEFEIPRIDPDRRITPIGLTISIEADPDRPDWSDWYARRIQFCQWTIQAKAGHPMLRELIIRIVEETKRKQKMGYLKKVEGKDKGGDIMQWTGPGIFTDVVFDYLNNIVSDGKLGDGFGVGSRYWKDGEKYKLKKVEVDHESGEPLNSDKQVISWKTLSNLRKPLILDDIMVLPITSFSPGVGQMGAGDSHHPLAFVQHMFSGSWKPANERI
ncbi:unnamed protein product [Ambrosiozyma monospora]|uniref:Unnamed protein product n=1 Tax=Ambrosiozyma monospora TaxID=43982 RepID=A0A9W6Z3K3_AMBMO|nr:unnamed protein product [Ambrosiozyma monospora]